MTLVGDRRNPSASSGKERKARQRSLLYSPCCANGRTRIVGRVYASATQRVRVRVRSPVTGFHERLFLLRFWLLFEGTARLSCSFAKLVLRIYCLGQTSSLMTICANRPTGPRPQ